jgi:hypothetical protein
MDKVALGQSLLRALRVSFVTVFPTISILIFVYTFLLPDGQRGADWESLKRSIVS